MGKHRKPKNIIVVANNPPKIPKNPRPKPPVKADVPPKIKLPKKK